jgi:membrane protein YdbS with pleckstrin-like domain
MKSANSDSNTVNQEAKLVIPKVWKSEFALIVLSLFLLIAAWFLTQLFSWSIIKGVFLNIGNFELILKLPVFFLIPLTTLSLVCYRLYNVKFIVDEQGIEARTGILSIKQQTIRIRFEDIRSVQSKQGLLERLLNVGNVEIGTAATGNLELVLSGVNSPLEVREMIEREKTSRNKQLRSAFHDYNEKNYNEYNQPVSVVVNTKKNVLKGIRSKLKKKTPVSILLIFLLHNNSVVAETKSFQESIKSALEKGNAEDIETLSAKGIKNPSEYLSKNDELKAAEIKLLAEQADINPDNNEITSTEELSSSNIAPNTTIIPDNTTIPNTITENSLPKDFQNNSVKTTLKNNAPANTITNSKYIAEAKNIEYTGKSTVVRRYAPINTLANGISSTTDYEETNNKMQTEVARLIDENKQLKTKLALVQQSAKKTLSQLDDIRVKLMVAETQVERLTALTLKEKGRKGIILNGLNFNKYNINKLDTTPLEDTAYNETQASLNSKVTKISETTNYKDLLIATISTLNLNLRSGPGVEYPVVTTAKEGTRLTVENKENNWYQVITSGGIRAWAHQTGVKISHN